MFLLFIALTWAEIISEQEPVPWMRQPQPAPLAVRTGSAFLHAAGVIAPRELYT